MRHIGMFFSFYAPMDCFFASSGCGAGAKPDKRRSLCRERPNLVQTEKLQIDFVGAQPLTLPLAVKFSNQDANRAMVKALGVQPSFDGIVFPGVSTGSIGRGLTTPVSLGAPRPPRVEQNTLGTMDFGSANLPFSTSRADLFPNATNEQYPYRAAGKLFFAKDNSTYICSASLIKKGVVLTAAHCVADFGKKNYYAGWRFVPGYREGIAPFDVWDVAEGFVLTSYLDGSDTCQVAGVICQDDMAVLVLSPKKDQSGQKYYAGTNTGWFSYGWDRNGFTAQKITHVTQLGYPGCLDNAQLMERNDSQGIIDPENSSNTIIGSMMCGGSSGGAWLINFGVQPTLTGTVLGRAPTANQVIGVTSWGSTDNAVKWMGASPFLSTNIVPLVNAACKAYPDTCGD